jgi:hypothetical protein
MTRSIIKPSAATSKQFAAVALALKLVERNVRNDINRETRATLNPVWRSVVNSNAVSQMDRLVLAKGARVKPGNPTVLTAASSRRPLSGGLVPDEDARVWEFGSPKREKVKKYQRRNRAGSGSHTVTRHTSRQLPAPDKGRVVYKSFAEIAPRLTSLWVQIVVRNIYEAHEKR